MTPIQIMFLPLYVTLWGSDLIPDILIEAWIPSNMYCSSSIVVDGPIPLFPHIYPGLLFLTCLYPIPGVWNKIVGPSLLRISGLIHR